ncbi:hypothetical protein DFAR_3760005 [Desulfarculales bacterium]
MLRPARVLVKDEIYDQRLRTNLPLEIYGHVNIYRFVSMWSSCRRTIF